MQFRQKATTLVLRNAVSLSLLIFAIPVSAESTSTWSVLETETLSSGVTLRSPSGGEIDSQAHSFLITHGMYGTEAGDRFHLLAEAVSRIEPRSNVVLIDWTPAARTRSKYLHVITPPAVAEQIDRVAEQAAILIDELGIKLDRTTLIGESFGNWVNAGIAGQLGTADRILAMNPANEFSGYAPRDLRMCSHIALSFHTYSLCDTLQPIADVSIFLDTPADFDLFAQHTSGICRLTKLLMAGNDQWLHVNGIGFKKQPETFDARATLDGTLIPTDLPRKRAVPNQLKKQMPAGSETDSPGNLRNDPMAAVTLIAQAGESK